MRVSCARHESITTQLARCVGKIVARRAWFQCQQHVCHNLDGSFSVAYKNFQFKFRYQQIYRDSWWIGLVIKFALVTQWSTPHSDGVVASYIYPNKSDAPDRLITILWQSKVQHSSKSHYLQVIGVQMRNHLLSFIGPNDLTITNTFKSIDT